MPILNQYSYLNQNKKNSHLKKFLLPILNTNGNLSKKVNQSNFFKKKKKIKIQIDDNNKQNKIKNKHYILDTSPSYSNSSNNSNRYLTDEERYPYSKNKYQNLHTDINKVIRHNDKILRNTSYKLKNNDRQAIVKGAEGWLNATYSNMFYLKEPNKQKRAKLYKKNIKNGFDQYGIMPRCIYNNMKLKYTKKPSYIDSKGRKSYL